MAKRRENRNNTSATMLVIAMGFLIIYAFTGWQWAMSVSLAVGIIGIVSDTLSRAVEKAWMTLAGVLSYIIPTILLAAIFYLILFPIALVYRLFHRDTLKLSREYDTLFVEVNREPEHEDFHKIW